MAWLLLVGIGVLLFSVESLLNRVLMKDKKSDPYIQTVVFTGLVGVWSFLILIFQGGFKGEILPNQIPYLFLVSVLVILGGICTFSGFKYIEASKHTILLTSSRLWVVFGAIAILGESFTPQKLIGAILIIFGVIVTVWKKQKFSINTGVLYVLGAAFFYAMGEIYSFYLLRSMNSVSFMLVVTVITTLIMLMIKPKTIFKLPFYKKRQNLLNILVVTVFDTFANLLVFIAYQKGRSALQIGPIMSIQTIITVVLAFIFLKETDNLFQKITGAIVAVVGTVLLL